MYLPRVREKTGRLTQEQTRRVGVAGLRRVCAASRDVQLVALKAVLEGRARLMRWIRFHVPARYCVADMPCCSRTEATPTAFEIWPTVNRDPSRHLISPGD